MAENLRLVSAGLAGLAARQPRVAVGGIGLGALLLTELTVTLLGHAVA